MILDLPSQDGRNMSIRLWDVKIGQQRAKLDCYSGKFYSVNFSPDGTTLISYQFLRNISYFEVLFLH
ncbi:unnamed protein product (macronuclear) [Paramecium tetraurelia]|uniref:Translation initiation factor beta propellor-like domain-containing protein n=1 Tax=Paramecium tetraurelia TaxID=5888 RepID=A0CUU9_PARTE|nr:uncharacterized protein GSPATT00039021001 [Paramecium tetraurelia]CAK74566.1 unnamed protein product [Paramecium tetraurelia]|eukprot:XP_001441963.1 hypothetical protein (macronuclear) [Paramecium tetraurelia strain d4-2]